ncbi:hypothetical protein, partial [Providencia sp. T47]|uniref:hypothetical protein n=1 Tax=Providencia sp. T47 TaxID=3395376 RepID=UPI0039BC2378
ALRRGIKSNKSSESLKEERSWEVGKLGSWEVRTSRGFNANINNKLVSPKRKKATQWVAFSLI